MNQRRHLFVYGSLSEGMVHFAKIAEFVASSEPASVLGEVYRLPVGFPVLKLSGEAGSLDRVPGHCVELEGEATFWAFLDEFHGFHPSQSEQSLFWRSSVEAQLADGVSREAEVYHINPSKLPRGSSRIRNGDWINSLRERPALTNQLTARQRSYILRLGSSTGREIVPIDINLYRELMNLELIVDKGRRLALSRLGQEVYRYLV